MVKYSIETKLEAVSLYQNGIGTREIRARLGIKSDSLIYSWIEQYKKHGKTGLKTKRTKNKYSGQFKLEVLNWRKQHNESYQRTAAHFNVSNTGIIANWQRAFSQGGIDALNVKLGRPPMQKKKAKKKRYDKSELSELEKLRLENHALHVEVEYLKKLDALVQKRGHLPKKDKSSKN